MNKQPQITERTKAALCKAFWTLYSEHTLSDISVRQITDLSGYNRGTFYLYYRDLHDMLHQIEEGLLLKLESLVASLTEHTQHYNVAFALEEVLQFMLTQRNYFTVLLGTHAEPMAQRRCAEALWTVLAAHHSQSAQQDTNAISTRYIKSYVTQGLLATIVEWLSEAESVTSAEEHTTAEELSAIMLSTLIPSQLQ